MSSKPIEDEVQALCDEAFVRGYNKGVMDASEDETSPAPPDDEIQGNVECEVMFDLQSDVELSEKECTKIRYQAALMAAVKSGLDLGYEADQMLADLDDIYEDMEGE